MLHKLCSHFSGISSALKAPCYSSNRRNLERSHTDMAQRGCGVLTLHRVVELSDPRESSTNHKDTTTAKANPSNERTQINSPKWPSRIASGQSMKPKPPLSIKGERDISPRSQGASTKDESMSHSSFSSCFFHHFIVLAPWLHALQEPWMPWYFWISNTTHLHHLRLYVEHTIFPIVLAGQCNGWSATVQKA